MYLDQYLLVIGLGNEYQWRLWNFKSLVDSQVKDNAA